MRMMVEGFAAARAVATSAPREFLLGPVMRICFVRLMEVFRDFEDLGAYRSFQ